MAEINFNNLYNQLTPMQKDQYDGVFGSSGFKNKYSQNPDSSLVTQNSNYQKFKAIADAEQQVPKESFISSAMSALNPFSELSAAEMPQVPNVSLGTPQINFNTGITGASSAIPNINGVPMINTGAINQKLQNTDLVSQIIAANQAANANKFGNTVAPFPGNQFSQVNNQVPSQNFEFLQSAYEDQDEDAAQVEYLPGQKKKLSDMGRNFGISSLLSMITGNPIIGLLSKGMGALKQDPRATGIRNFYSPEGLTSTGSVASGIMRGYNPVSGGFLNMITGGKFGKPTQYGLSGAMQRRIENIIGRRAPQTDSSRSKISELRNLQRQEMQDRSGRGESLGSIGRSTFSGPGRAFEKQNSGTGKGPR